MSDTENAEQTELIAKVVAGDEPAPAEPPDAAPPQVDASNWADSVPFDETGVLIRPVNITSDEIETMLLDVAAVRRAVGPRRTGAVTAGEAAERNPEAGGALRRFTTARWVLLAILTLQAVLSLRGRNTAFEDEALYLYSGHLELGHLLNGTPTYQDFTSYFSGSPVLYPVVASIFDQLGGVFAARLFSLFCLLSTTTLLYMLTRRMFNERVALCAAALFSISASVVFIGDLATYDAPALCLLALAAWIVVRTAKSPWPLYLLAALPAALATGTKYAALLFVPGIVILAALSAVPYHGLAAYLRPVTLAAAITGLIAGALELAGSTYIHGIQETTTARAQGTTPVSTVLRESVQWGGVLFGVAVVGAVLYAWRPGLERGEAPVSGRVTRILLGVLLAGTALLAPAYQIHLHTDVSLQKHVGFGLFFAAPMAGVGVVRLVGHHLHRPQVGLLIWAGALVIGMQQSVMMFNLWPNSTTLVEELRAYQAPNANYLVETDEVPIYYMRGDRDAEPYQFTTTYTITYTDHAGQTLTGTAGFQQAVKDGYFHIIAYDFGATAGLDQMIQNQLQTDPRYQLVAALPTRDYYGISTFYVWVKK